MFSLEAQHLGEIVILGGGGKGGGGFDGELSICHLLPPFTILPPLPVFFSLLFNLLMLTLYFFQNFSFFPHINY